MDNSLFNFKIIEIKLNDKSILLTQNSGNIYCYLIKGEKYV